MKRWKRSALRPLTPAQDAEYECRLEDEFAKGRDKRNPPPCEGEGWIHTGSHIGCDDDDEWD